ncbi:hypothetical protein L249_5051 [Ophiocordyceps polyrhachis-furcata BCC 54312]|uniref:O-methyltransferase domain-containing protein n=1 Tax=Ophiocordyceps polyrhachis-furcata BCC 54312 TaxID=1330021 RepID=A0A367L3I4_9HYPO|nr:hypothetical protein L249_5051 [Ophiocordyceps polyrhachis-furcata BCC 54312]
MDKLRINTRNTDRCNKVLEYAYKHSTALPAPLTSYHSEAVASRDDSAMLSSNAQSQLHGFLARAVGARNVLEVGVYVGYSAMAWAYAVGSAGTVTGLEVDEGLAGIARGAFAERGLGNVEVVVGNAAETLPKLKPSEPYDIVFLDADKPGYIGYLDTLLGQSLPGSRWRLLRPGALIIADNVLRSGHVADDSLPFDDSRSDESWRSHIDAIRAFNDRCVAEARLETFMLPLWDGVSLLRLRD